MSAREFFNNNPAIVTAGAVVVLVLCLAAIACSLFGGPGGSGSNSVKLVFYDVGADSIMLIPSKDRPGSPLADNEQAFSCFVMSCGECGEIKKDMTKADIEAGGMFIAYLQTFPDAERVDPMMMDDTQVGVLEADGSVTWYGMSTQEGMDVMRNVMNHSCDNESVARQCQP